MCEAASKGGYVNPHDVQEILGISQKEESEAAGCSMKTSDIKGKMYRLGTKGKIRTIV